MDESEDRRVEGELPGRWSPQRRAEVVLRLINGEDLGALSRETKIPSSWRWTWTSLPGSPRTYWARDRS